MIVMGDYELRDGEEWLVTDETVAITFFLVGIILLGSFIGSLIMLWIRAVSISQSMYWILLISLYLLSCVLFLRYLVRIVID